MIIDKVQKIIIIKVLIKEILIMSKKNSKPIDQSIADLPYHYYNCNPHHKATDDCVIRAICSSTGSSWEDTIRELTEYSIKMGYMLNTPECYGKYLADRGYVKQRQPTHKDGTKIRFYEFVKMYDGHAICHCGKNHITYVSDNSAWDIWDVSEEIVGNYWVHKAELEFVKKMEK